MTIPTNFIQDIVARTDIVQIIGERIALKKSGANHMACCPFHREKTPSFSVSESKQIYHCFGCGENGNAIGFLIAYDSMEFPQAVEYLANMHGLQVPQEGKQQGPTIDQGLYDVMQASAQYYQRELRSNQYAIDYLKERGLNGQTAKQFAVGFASKGWSNLLQRFRDSKQKQQLVTTGMVIMKDDKTYDRFRHRIMIPIRDTRGRVIAFGGRAVSDDNPPKYLNSPETPLFHKSKELFGLYEARIANRDLHRIVICEGYMDVIALFQHGINYAVATLGTASNAQHIYKVLRYTKNIIFCFDGDNAGRAAAWKALLICLPLIRDGIKLNFVFLPDDEDPDSYVRRNGSAAFIQLLDTAEPLSSFFFKHLMHGENLNSLDNKASFGAKAIELIDKIKPGIYQDLMKKQLSKILNYDINEIEPPIQKTPNTAPTSRASTQSSSPNLIRKAIILLLQNPDVAAKCQLVIEKSEGEKVLNQLICELKKNPKLSTGSLISQFSDEMQQRLLTLANSTIEIPQAEQQSELIAIIKSLGENTKNQINALLQKAKITALQHDEKQLLQKLILQQSQQNA